MIGLKQLRKVKWTELICNIAFSAVQQQIKRMLKQQLPTRIDIERTKINQWVDKSIGTVHTFQGKEAQKVYFVIGTDNTQDGAVNWSCENQTC